MGSTRGRTLSIEAVRAAGVEEALAEYREAWSELLENTKSCPGAEEIYAEDGIRIEYGNGE